MMPLTRIFFESINREVEEINKKEDSSVFTNMPFNTREVKKAVNSLKGNKSCGFDGVSAEHVKFGGNLLIITL